MIMDTDYQRITKGIEKCHTGGLAAGAIFSKILKFLFSKVGLIAAIVVCGLGVLLIGFLRGASKKDGE